MNKIFLLSFLLFGFVSLHSQNYDALGSWNLINIKGIISNKWSFFAEGQLRSLKFYDDFHYHEYKGGINYEIKKQFRLTLAAGKYDTYKEGGDFVLPKNNDEFRIWPQLTISQSIGKFNIEQRYRTELRYTSTGFRNRYRYRLGISLPFGKELKLYKRYQIGISNEIFFTNTEPYFERNRLLLSCNYKPSKSTTIQIGYLHQFDYKINDETGSNFFQIAYLLDLVKNDL
jgi:long-subunit fatty acid transport protein